MPVAYLCGFLPVGAATTTAPISFGPYLLRNFQKNHQKEQFFKLVPPLPFLIGAPSFWQSSACSCVSTFSDICLHFIKLTYKHIILCFFFIENTLYFTFLHLHFLYFFHSLDFLLGHKMVTANNNYKKILSPCLRHNQQHPCW